MYCLLTRHIPVALSKQILMKALIINEKKNLDVLDKTLDKKLGTFTKKNRSTFLKGIYLGYK